MKFKLLCVMLFLCSLAVSAADGQGYTSLVIDATGLELSRSESPKILSEKGYEVYGTIFDNLEKALEDGVFFYVPNIATAKKWDASRVGDNPLTVKAKSVTGVAMTDIVISDLDALKILKENKISKFLEKFRVVVIVSSQGE